MDDSKQPANWPAVPLATTIGILDSMSSAVLLPELAEFLAHHDYACVTEATDQGTVFVIKMPTPDIASIRGPVPILLQQALYQHPVAPVIRLLVNIFDQPTRPLALETFINVANDQQHANYAALTQTELPLLFYDDALIHQLTKVVPYRQQQESAAILAVAEHLRGTIPPDRFNFEVAKAAVMRATRL